MKLLKFFKIELLIRLYHHIVKLEENIMKLKDTLLINKFIYQ